MELYFEVLVENAKYNKVSILKQITKLNGEE